MGNGFEEGVTLLVKGPGRTFFTNQMSEIECNIQGLLKLFLYNNLHVVFAVHFHPQLSP